MHLIHVVPLSRGSRLDELSYFTKDALEPGSLVKVPLRSKDAPALVVRSEPVAEAKARIRSSAFRIKKIKVASATTFLPPATLAAARRSADYYATSVGAILFSILPKAVLDDPRTAAPAESPVAPQGGTPKRYAFQGTSDKRITHYKHLVRAAFSRKRSVVVLAPTIAEAERIHAALARGIPRYCMLFHSGITGAALRKQWRAALSDPHPLAIVMTSGFLALPRHDIDTLIIDREGAPSYKQHARPFVAGTTLAHFLADAHGWSLLRTDLPLSIDTISAFKQGRYEEFDITPMTIATDATTTLVDMRNEPAPKNLRIGTPPFAIASGELITRLRGASARGERSVLLVGRRGIAPTSVCGDCGETVICAACGASVVLHKGTAENVFVCHACGAMRSAHERCLHCTSWRLTALGIGVERVLEELSRLAPQLPLHRFDRDVHATHRQAARAYADFAEEAGAVLVGTEMLLPYLRDSVSLSAIVSVDALLSVPEWNVYERFFSLVLRLREHARDHFILQTRLSSQDVLKQALAGDVASFYKSEIADRRQFHFPPFSHLIKLSAEGSRADVVKQMERLEQLLAPFGFTSVPHVFTTAKKTSLVHGFLRTDAAAWPNPELVALLRGLPPSVAINVDPESIL